MRPIAMKCNQEEFDSIKDRINLPIKHLDKWTDKMYLVNNLSGLEVVSNLEYPINHDREIHETFDANIFLQACDIEVEKFWKGSEMQIEIHGTWFDCNDVNNYRLKPQPNYQKEIEALQQKAKENGMNVIINFEKI